MSALKGRTKGVVLNPSPLRDDMLEVGSLLWRLLADTVRQSKSHVLIAAV
jgi:hypothetical protein